MLQRVSSDVLIVPQHVWGTVRDPVQYTNPDAVGTGPFKPTSFNGQELVLSRNARYWQADKIRIGKLIFHNNQGGGQVDQLNLAQGKYDSNAMFVPNIQQVYVSRDPQHNHYWFPPGGVIALGFNLTKAPFNDVPFRRAVAYVIDRQSISTKAEYGYVTAASQTGLDCRAVAHGQDRPVVHALLPARVVGRHEAARGARARVGPAATVRAFGRADHRA
jgi:peptide/nickel transport system substrate-binding protein